MVTNDDLYTNALAQLTALGETNINEAVLKSIVAKVPKTSIDVTLVAGTDDNELDYIVQNFMKKKLGEDNTTTGRAKLDAVMTKMKGVNRKQRATVYYLLVVEYGKESVYL